MVILSTILRTNLPLCYKISAETASNLRRDLTAETSFTSELSKRINSENEVSNMEMPYSPEPTANETTEFNLIGK